MQKAVIEQAHLNEQTNWLANHRIRDNSKPLNDTSSNHFAPAIIPKLPSLGRDEPHRSLHAAQAFLIFLALPSQTHPKLSPEPQHFPIPME